MSGKFSRRSASPTISVTDGAVAAGEVAGRGGKLGGAKVVGRRVDEIAREIDAIGDAADLGGIDAGGEDETARARRVSAR